jgi:serine/threonine protein kinase
MMRSEWGRVRELFERALEEHPGDLDAWLAREAPDSPEVRAEVRSLLEHNSQAGEFLNQPVAERVPALLEDEPAYSAGHVIGPYTIVRELGRGGMGRVYLADDARLGRAVALKALAPRLTRDPSHRERLRREARAAAGVTHPGICTIYALEEHDGELFIAAEYLDGHTLRDEIASGPPPGPSDLLRTARELADALASAHAKGVVHRDLKPENVMRTADGRLKILDFGLARVEGSAADGSGLQITQPGVLVGTPGYMAPEQLNGQRGDARADVFAFGVTLYEYACGVHPFTAPSAIAVAARILQSDAAPLEAYCPNLPVALAAVVERCLRKSPSERFGSAAEIAAAIASERAATPRPVVRWWRTHQAVVIGLYFIASAAAWQIKEWHGGAASAIFGVIGVAATAAAVFRGHLLFTEQMNRRALHGERRRADVVTAALDLVISAALLIDAAIASADHTLVAVLMAGLAVGLSLARLIVERATASAAFGT